MSARATATQIIHQVLSKRSSLDAVIFNTDLSRFSEKDQRFIRELCFGTLRYYYRLEPISKQLLHKPIPEKHLDVFCLLLIGLYQIIYLRTPTYAAISATVEAAKKLKKNWATGLLNKTLRVFCDKQDEILIEVDKDPGAKYAHPQWLTGKIKKAWPDHWQQILTANNHQAPMAIRTNPALTTTQDYLALLTKAGIEAELINSLPFAIQLKSPCAVNQLPSFDKGYCYIQDAAGQYVAPLLQLAPHMRVLDACAAPGSKTTDIASTEPQLEKLVAIDVDKNRVQKIKENIDRLQLSEHKIQLISANAVEIDSWWDKKPFDRIIIDAPCSATGVIRRHPDIKLLRLPEDIENQAKLQFDLLNNLWALLKPDGLLLYTTCSILREENEKNIDAFLNKHLDAKVCPISVPNAIPLKHGVQLLPTANGPDGFYYALLSKVVVA